MPSLFETTRQMIVTSFMALPLMMIAFTLFVGLGIGNIGLIILLLGQILLVPAASMLLHLVTGSFFTINSRDICNLVPSANKYGFVPSAPSFWMAEVLFFMSYLIRNAYTIYNQDAVTGASDVKVQNRKDRLYTSMVIGILITLLFVYLRYSFTGCETMAGVAISALVFVPLGIYWYDFAALCGAKNADVFGISASILPKGSDKTQVCIKV